MMKEAVYDDLFERFTLKYLPPKFDWRIIKAQAWQESRFDRLAVSPAGAQGVMQIMPGTWADWGKGYIDEPEDNIRTGIHYFSYLYGQWSWPRPEIDRICLALASYNAGLGHLLKAQKLADDSAYYGDIIKELDRVTGRHSMETTDYVRKITWFWIQHVISKGGVL